MFKLFKFESKKIVIAGHSLALSWYEINIFLSVFLHAEARLKLISSSIGGGKLTGQVTLLFDIQKNSFGVSSF